MSALQDALGRVVADLRGLDRRIALVGGLAVSVRAEPRFTRDVDLAVVVTGDDDAEALSRALQARGLPGARRGRSRRRSDPPSSSSSNGGSRAAGIFAGSWRKSWPPDG
ncbi:nucleotidyl transferase AbiEii/AbiGii toxin family protein [Sorangium sp. So ce315]|uniref:nucleotidyl transferase AbiEii/AbiGii toxin family protein n=1 Tax=Sorangium sp. So ce315 TaxID=3133299 RepID=UPI003F639527